MQASCFSELTTQAYNVECICNKIMFSICHRYITIIPNLVVVLEIYVEIHTCSGNIMIIVISYGFNKSSVSIIIVSNIMSS